jgi:hypothetical protein
MTDMVAPGNDAGSRFSPRRLHVLVCVLAWLLMSVVPLFAQVHAREFAATRLEEVLFHLIKPLAWIKSTTGLDLVAQMWIVAALVPLAMLAVVTLLEWLVRRWRLDEHDDSWTSIGWALRTWRGWLQWLGLVAAGAAIGSTALLLPGNWWLIGVVPVALAFLTISFLAGNADNLAPAEPPGRWRLRWPGAFAVVVAIVEIAGGELFDRLVDTVDPGLLADALIAIVLLVPSIVISLFASITWLRRAPPTQARAMLRTALSRRLIVVSIVQGLRVGTLVVPLLVALLPIALLQIFVVPQVEYALRHVGRDFSPFWSATFAVAPQVQAWWWAALLPLAWFAVVAPNRLLVQLGALSDEADAVASPYAGVPSALRSSR